MHSRSNSILPISALLDAAQSIKKGYSTVCSRHFVMYGSRYFSNIKFEEREFFVGYKIKVCLFVYTFKNHCIVLYAPNHHIVLVPVIFHHVVDHPIHVFLYIQTYHTHLQTFLLVPFHHHRHHHRHNHH
jgi:hypothetical protein